MVYVYNELLNDVAKKYDIPYSYIPCMANELKSNKKSDAFYYNQLEISYLPETLRKAIWRRNAVPRITKLFWDVYERVSVTEAKGESHCWNRFGSSARNLWPVYDFPHKPMTWSRLHDSWLYKAMYDWVFDENVDLPDREEVRQVLFEIAIAKPSKYVI